MKELKPCPFCGGDSHFREVVSCSKTLYAAGCYDYGCIGFETLYYVPTKDDAAEAWNRRANECDRDALLYIADELESFAEQEYCAYGIDEPICNKISSFADRIRKSIGE